MIRLTGLWLTLGLVLLGGAAAAQTPTRVRGTIDQLSGNSLAVTTRSGQKVNVTLADPVAVLTIVKYNLDDIKQGSNVGITSVPQPDGTMRALEVTVVPAGQRVNPTDSPWDLAPSSRMTNGSVGEVVVSSGRTLTVNYGTGQRKIVVPDDAPVVTLTPGDRSLLKPGANVVVFARKADDGALTAGAVAVGKDGLVPPM